MGAPDMDSPMGASADSKILLGLIQRIARSDEKALTELHRRMGRRILSFISKYIYDADAAEAVLNATLFEVWKNASRYEERAAPTTWLFCIARCKALDEYRRQARHANQENIENFEIPDGAESAFEEIARSQEAAIVKACLAKLPAEQRECIQLVFNHDLSLERIAEIQGVPTNTVKTRLFHARRKLRLMLESKPDFAMA